MLRKLGAALALLLILLAAAHRPILRAAGAFLVEAHPPVHADMVLVLAGDGYGHRILKGAQLVREGWAPKVLVSGPDGTYGFYECDMAIPFAVRAGYPEEYFLHFENTARSTREEARMAAGELRRLGVKKVLVVTSDYHTRRSARMYQEAAPDLEVTVVAAPSRDFTPDGWWRSRQGQKLFFYEWLKTIATWLNL
jgi:uncharacterized SAM-binding protein YcdF (DUF218 family)